jgi:hypothetical protein
MDEPVTRTHTISAPEGSTQQMSFLVLRRAWLVACSFVAVSTACRGDVRSTGRERGPCFENGTCHQGLVCRSQVCVQPAAGEPTSGTLPSPTAASTEPIPTGLPTPQAAFEGWLKAQNDGDFAAYSALYAAEFTGVRRSGPEKRHFDRDGWLKDRARMFKAKMKVTTSDAGRST